MAQGMTYSSWLVTSKSAPSTPDYRAVLCDVQARLDAMKLLVDSAIGNVAIPPTPPVPPTPPIDNGRGPVTDEVGVLIKLNDADETLVDQGAGWIRDPTLASGTVLLRIGAAVWLLGGDGNWYWRNSEFQSWSNRGPEHP
jgi:hypothetical protein